MVTEMIKITATPQGACWFWHRWALVKIVGPVEYFACRDCAARHARQPKSLPNGIQHNWVLGITNSISPFGTPRNPPPKRP